MHSSMSGKKIRIRCARPFMSQPISYIFSFLYNRKSRCQRKQTLSSKSPCRFPSCYCGAVGAPGGPRRTIPNTSTSSTCPACRTLVPSAGAYNAVPCEMASTLAFLIESNTVHAFRSASSSNLMTRPPESCLTGLNTHDRVFNAWHVDSVRQPATAVMS